jgi:hypothetical protein
MKLENFSLPPGWESLRAPLMRKIESFEFCGGCVRQVKEKFGRLTIYAYRVGSENHLDFKDELELASTLCMECGQPAAGFQPYGWVGPRCQKHLQ